MKRVVQVEQVAATGGWRVVAPVPLPPPTTTVVIAIVVPSAAMRLIWTPSGARCAT